MASFTDKIPTFNPYIQQLPVEAMVKVGMDKQQRYDQGVQKIQSSIDQIAGLDVVRDVDKAYLQSKVNELGNNLKTFMASDFSDYQLVNSVAGMTGQITKDPKVLNAISSTMKYRKEVGFMEEDRKKGTLAPENELYFAKQARPWLDSSDVSESFSGKYVPYLDVFKYAKEVFDSVKPDNYSFDQIFKTDSNGNLIINKQTGMPEYAMTMKTLEKEGLFPEKVRETLNQIFSDPKVSRQLNITGQYALSGLDETQLKERIETKRDNEVIDYQEKLLELKMMQSIGKEDYSLEIAKLEDNIDKINSSYDELSEITDLDSLRGSLYRQDVYGRYQKMFGYTKTKESYKDNPGFKMEFELNKAAQERADRLRSHNLEVAKFEETKNQNRITNDLARMKIIAEGNKKGLGPLGPETASVEAPYDTGRSYSNMAESKYTTAANNFSTAQDLLIYNTLFNDEASNEAVKDIMNSGEGISRKRAINLYLKQVASGKIKTEQTKNMGKAMEIGAFRTKFVAKAKEQLTKRNIKTNEMQDLVQSVEDTQKIFKQESVFKKERDRKTDELVKQLGLDKDFVNIKPETVLYRGKTLTISKQDQIDMAVYMNANASVFGAEGEDADALESAAQQAKKRLDKKGLGDIAERALQTGRFIRNASSISGITGLVSTVLSTARDTGGFIFTGDRTLLSKFESKMFDLAVSISDKGYQKVYKNQENIIKNQYGINPNRAYSLTTGDAETDRAIEANLAVDYNLFSKGDQSQNLATKEEFENFGKALDSKDSKFAIESTTDENGNPTFAVTTRTADGIGRMVLNADMAAKYGFTPSDVFEPKKVEYVRGAMNLYGGKTSVGRPEDFSTYNTGVSDYAYDDSDFKNLRSKNYSVRANVSELNGKYYAYIYMTDGVREVIYPSEGKPNLAQLDATLTTIVNDAFVQAQLSKVK